MASAHDPLAQNTMAPSTSRVTNGHADKDQAGVRVRVSQMTEHFRNTANDFGRSAAQNIDRNIDKAVGAMERTSSALRSRTGEGTGRMNRYAHTTADKLDATARYFREHHTDELVHGMEGFVRRKPATALGVAAGVGFFVGLMMTLDRDRD